MEPVFVGAQFDAAKTVEPPERASVPTPERVIQLRNWLEANQAKGSEADTTWQFYEVIDQYLGPFGEEGYPLAYGKAYNKAFMENEALMADDTTRAWIEQTGTALQEAITDYIVQRYEAGTLEQLTEPELREFAFDSHPKAYVESGLTNVVLDAPELLDNIVAVPGREFLPGSGNMLPSLEQAVVTGGMVAGEMIERAADTVVETVGKGIDSIQNSSAGQAVGKTVSKGWHALWQ